MMVDEETEQRGSGLTHKLSQCAAVDCFPSATSQPFYNQVVRVHHTSEITPTAETGTQHTAGFQALSHPCATTRPDAVASTLP